MRLKTNEWHELSLRKDVSFIKNNMNKGQNNISALLVEVFLTLFSMLIDNVLENNSIDPKIRTWVGIGFVIIIISIAVIWMICKLCHYKKMNWAIKHNRIDGKHYIDEFDNTICYIAMAAHSYVGMYNESKGLAEKHFCQLECEYYLRKCIKELFLMRNRVSIVFCKEENNTSSSKVDCRRLENIIELLKEIDAFLTETNHVCKSKIEYVKEINSFLEKYNNCFSTSLSWGDN